jgi:excisionase family DNA binding protein
MGNLRKRKKGAQMILTVDEFAKWAGLSSRSVYRLTKSNEIPYYRVGDRIRLNTEDFKCGQELPPRAEAPKLDLLGLPKMQDKNRKELLSALATIAKVLTEEAGAEGGTDE